jgi:hypothetical protein
MGEIAFDPKNTVHHVRDPLKKVNSANSKSVINSTNMSCNNY